MRRLPMEMAFVLRRTPRLAFPYRAPEWVKRATNQPSPREGKGDRKRSAAVEEVVVTGDDSFLSAMRQVI